MTRRSRITRGALAVLAGAWMLASPASMMPARAQAAWPFQLEWTQTGAQASYYRLCVNGACTVLHDARTRPGHGLAGVAAHAAAGRVSAGGRSLWRHGVPGRGRPT